ncbi:MAG: CBS domain-containing protein [Aliarcobacter sp.]|jgi:acetoin utilization protein AcuB|nr:CBS domain-containing protein [Aliarcobacter sp.]MBP6713498.1 CBS domain-containing protein [Aliarcobacter sp.]MDX9961140.1 CBS domain-containing protein [Aliarcobacter sp.]
MFPINRIETGGFGITTGNLYNVKNVNELSETKLKLDESFIQNFSNEKDRAQKKDEALDTYKKMVNIDTSEPVYQVKDIMTKNCIYIHIESTVNEAYESLNSLDVNQMPVVSFGKKIRGMINKKMILELLMDNLENSKYNLNKKIEEIKLPEIITVAPTVEIRKVAKVMIDFKLDAIPVVDENDILVGIVSKTDILKAISYLPKMQLWS